MILLFKSRGTISAAYQVIQAARHDLPENDRPVFELTFAYDVDVQVIRPPEDVDEALLLLDDGTEIGDML